ncbi:MAG: hypothetical protein H7296_14985 [Bacteroidia bacterium]|nr:hypothetical protein [Bacteroidia bacterium]
MIKTLLLTFFLSFHFFVSAQNSSIEIGGINNGVIEINNHQGAIVKAFEWTFRDGTKVTEIKIEQLSNSYFLVATCTYQTRKRIAAIDLEVAGIKFVLKEDAYFKMCSAVACENCRFFLENNRIVACKCEETGTISNHCHYRSSQAITFFANLQRAIKMEKED